MGKILKKNLQCLDPTCGSSDARQLYEDGTSFCFSCQSFFPANGEHLTSKREESTPVFRKRITQAEIAELDTRGFQERKVKRVVCDFYGVRVSYGEDGEIDAHYYPYEGGKAYKERRLPKSFSWIGKSSDLFGREKFQGGGKKLVICEGEIDTLSMAQASYDRYGKFYPIVGMSSSVMTSSLLENREWIRKFDEVIICMDEDDAGEHARKEAVRIIGLDRVKIMRLSRNDANEVLVNDGGEALISAMFDAKPHVPAGIISTKELWDSMVEYNQLESHPYPACLAGLNTKLKGKRKGEISLFISGTGSGKSTTMREIMLDILQTTDEKIGVVALEESPAETARKLSSMELLRNPAEEEIPIEDLKPAFDKVFGGDRVVLLDHQGSINDNSILDQLEYMCLIGCTYIFIDHITILVSEGVENLTGNDAQDKMMNHLLRLVKRHNVWLGLVSHLRKTPTGKQSFEEGRLPSMDDIRGSGSIKQVSMDIIAFARNSVAKDERRRNTMKLRVLKSRFTGLTGNVDGAFYNIKTGRLEYSEWIDDGDGDDFTAI